MSFIWTHEKTTVIIQLWEQYPELYSVTNREYHNKLRRMEAINKIRDEFISLTGEKITSEEITKKIHGLRTQFQRERGKEIKSKTSGISTDAVYVSKFWGYPLLRFLADTAAVRGSCDNLPSTSNKTPTPVEMLFEGTVEELEDSETQILINPEPATPDSNLLEHSPSTSVLGSKRRRGNASIEDFIKSAKQSLMELSKPIGLPPSPPKDQFSTFAANVGSELSAVKGKKRICALKIKIMNLIYEAQEEEEEEENN